MPAAARRGFSSSIARSMYDSRPLRRVSRSFASSRKRVGSRTLNARSSSSHLICQIPRRSASGRIDLQGLARDPELLLRRQRGDRPHVVEPVGELDEDDADVVRHRQEHLPDVLGLLLLVVQRRELATAS